MKEIHTYPFVTTNNSFATIPAHTIVVVFGEETTTQSKQSIIANQLGARIKSVRTRGRAYRRDFFVVRSSAYGIGLLPRGEASSKALHIHAWYCQLPIQCPDDPEEKVIHQKVLCTKIVRTARTWKNYDHFLAISFNFHFKNRRERRRRSSHASVL